MIRQGVIAAPGLIGNFQLAEAIASDNALSLDYDGDPFILTKE